MQSEPTSQQPQQKRSAWASRSAPEEGWVNGVFILMPDFVDALHRDLEATLANPVPLVGEDRWYIRGSAAAGSMPVMSFKWSPSTLSLLRRTVEAYNTGTHPVSDS